LAKEVNTFLTFLLFYFWPIFVVIEVTGNKIPYLGSFHRHPVWSKVDCSWFWAWSWLCNSVPF